MREALLAAPSVAESFEVLIIDDGSTDDTTEIAQRLSSENANVRVLRHTINKGYGEALKTGMKAAQYSWVFYSDGDLQFNLSEITLLVSEAANADVVVGYRIDRADPLYRQLNAAIYRLALRLFMRIRVRDVNAVRL